MSKLQISELEKYALWLAHCMKCFYCGEPISYAELEVDHIIPKYLLDHPGEYQGIDKKYGLSMDFPGFVINGSCNQVPAHGGSCNRRKGSSLFPKHTTLFYLSLVHRTLPRVEGELFLLKRNRRKEKALVELAAAVERSDLCEEDILKHLYLLQRKGVADQPLVVAIGLNLYELFEENLLPEKAPTETPALYDWLEEGLAAQLSAALSTHFHYTEPSHRNGECLTVRIAFPGLNPEELPRYFRPCWEILEVMDFYDLYGQPYEELYSSSSGKRDIQDYPA
jgi:hypothetical protein